MDTKAQFPAFYNTGTQPALIFPATGDQIAGSGANNGFSIGANKGTRFTKGTGTSWWVYGD